MKCTKCGVEFQGPTKVSITIDRGIHTTHSAPRCAECADEFCDVMEDWLNDGEPEEEGE